MTTLMVATADDNDPCRGDGKDRDDDNDDEE